MAKTARQDSDAEIVRLTYNIALDTLYVHLREGPVTDRAVDAGSDRRVLYAGDAPIGLEFRNVHGGVRTNGLPGGVRQYALAAAGFMTALLGSRDAGDEPAEADDDEENGRLGWSRLGLRELARDWDSEADRVYDQLR